MEDHKHRPIKFYSDAYKKPILVKCSECGETLDVSAELLETIYSDGPPDNVRYSGMAESGTQYKP